MSYQTAEEILRQQIANAEMLGKSAAAPDWWFNRFWYRSAQLHAKRLREGGDEVDRIVYPELVNKKIVVYRQGVMVTRGPK